MYHENIKILCIDDDGQIRYALNSVFEFQKWESFLAPDVNEGLRLFKQHRPDIVLIDYHMPEINGIQGVKLLREIDFNVPIIVFTIDEDQQIADQFLAAGASDFALKPIKAPDIISRIKLHIKLMRLRPSHEETTVKGIGATTRSLIVNYLNRCSDYQTAGEIAKNTGLAYQTTYRYLQHLISENVVESKNIYGKIGRPKQLFKIY
ncbi:response regulator [Oscillospiraceae bacterium LTW-04]|nr:response regulator [Oscillospiraceae bacterium MB24-C1]